MVEYYVGLLPDKESCQFLHTLATAITAALPRKNIKYEVVFRPIPMPVCVVAGPFCTAQEGDICAAFKAARSEADVCQFERRGLGVFDRQIHLLLAASAAGRVEGVGESWYEKLRKYWKSGTLLCFPPPPFGCEPKVACVVSFLPRVDLVTCSLAVSLHLQQCHDPALASFYSLLDQLPTDGTLTFDGVALFRRDDAGRMTTVHTQRQSRAA